MGIHEEPIAAHWNYFLTLEEDISVLARYLEPTKHNFDAYSVELARILFAAASEVDVVAKQLCKKIDLRSKADNIKMYQAALIAHDASIATARISIPKYGLTLNPWEGWEQPEHSPLWWRAYNNVKHKRHTHYQEANLKHALNAVGALFVLLIFFYEQQAHDGRLNPSPSLFRISAPFRMEPLAFANHEFAYRRP